MFPAVDVACCSFYADVAVCVGAVDVVATVTSAIAATILIWWQLTLLGMDMCKCLLNFEIPVGREGLEFSQRVEC